MHHYAGYRIYIVYDEYHYSRKNHDYANCTDKSADKTDKNAADNRFEQSLFL